MEIPDEIIESLLPAVDQQLESPDTPFVKKTYDRLTTKENLSSDEAKDLIAQTLAITSNRMITSGKPFDMAFYKDLLTNLPDLPGE